MNQKRRKLRLIKIPSKEIVSELLSQLVKGFSHTDNNFLSKITSKLGVVLNEFSLIN